MQAFEPSIRDGDKQQLKEVPNMQQPALNRLLTALDTLTVNQVDQSELSADLEVAAARLACLERRLGDVAAASPYLEFLRRTVAQASVQHGFAASA